MNADMAEHRVFFAVQPDEATGEQVFRFTGRLQRQEPLRGRPIARQRLHVTLGMVGRWPRRPPDDVIDLARQIADQIAMRPFKTEFKRLQSWGKSKGPLVLVGDDEAVGLELLHDALYAAWGLEPDPQFRPHMSLIWSPDRLPDRRVRPFGWTVREFVLIHSVYGQSRHDILGRWPLKAETPEPPQGSPPAASAPPLDLAA